MALTSGNAANGDKNRGRVQRIDDLGFAELLKQWRQRRRLSQLELALSSGVSQRHLSFLESSRARPSRAMVIQLSEALDVPLRQRNDWLNAAGFAAAYRNRSLEDPKMAPVLAAVRMMLDNHQPFPALAIDRAWNVVMANEPFESITGLFGSDRWQQDPGQPRNVLRLFFHPLGIRPFVANWDQIAPLMWQRAKREAETWGGEDVKKILADLSDLVPQAGDWAQQGDMLAPVVTVDIALGELRLSMFVVMSTFGTAQDITTDELRVEMYFPADEATERLLRSGR